MRREASILACLGGLVFAIASGCSSGNADQCNAGATGDADCATILGVGPGQAFCDLGTCRPKGSPPPAQQDAGNPVDSGPTAIPCESTDRCTAENGGRPSICREAGKTPCLALENDLCSVGPLTVSAWKFPNPIFIGVSLATKMQNGQDDAYMVTVKRLIELAEADWNRETANGLDLPSGRRPLVPIYCDTNGDPAATQRAFDHLTVTLGAPAYIAALSAHIFPILTQAQQRKTFIYLTEGPCDLFGTEAGGALNGQCFTTTPPYTYSVPMMVKLSAGLEARIRTDRGLTGSDKLKIAVLRANRPEALLLDDLYAKELDATLDLNGQRAKLDTTTYKVFTDKLNADGTIDFVSTSEAIAAFEPDIILTTQGGYYLHLFYIPLIEAAWKGAFRPNYVTNDNAAFAFAIDASVGSNRDIAKRISGAHLPFAAASVPSYNKMVQRFQPLFGDNFGTSTGYDAYYATAYAIAAALTSGPTPGPLSGVDIAAGLKKRLTVADGSDPVTEFTDDAITGAVAKLRAGKTIDVRGTQNELDWNSVTGDVDAEGAQYCVTFPPFSPANIADTDFTYSTKTKSFNGTDNGCP